MGYIYLIKPDTKNDLTYKVGRTVNLEKRLEGYKGNVRLIKFWVIDDKILNETEHELMTFLTIKNKKDCDFFKSNEKNCEYFIVDDIIEFTNDINNFLKTSNDNQIIKIHILDKVYKTISFSDFIDIKLSKEFTNGTFHIGKLLNAAVKKTFSNRLEYDNIISKYKYTNLYFKTYEIKNGFNYTFLPDNLDNYLHFVYKLELLSKKNMIEIILPLYKKYGKEYIKDIFNDINIDYKDIDFIYEIELGNTINFY